MIKATKYKRKLNTGGNIGSAVGTGATSMIPGVGPALAPLGGMVGGLIGSKIGNKISGDPRVPMATGRGNMGYKYGGNMNKTKSTGSRRATTSKKSYTKSSGTTSQHRARKPVSTGSRRVSTTRSTGNRSNFVKTYAVGGALGSSAQPIGNDAVRYDGPPHEQGGIPIDEMGNPTDEMNATAEVEGNETRQGDFIFSDELMVPETDMTFAEAHEMILAEGGGEEEVEQLAQMQEQLKQEQGIDNEVPAPVDQGIPEEGMMEEPMMEDGGKLPKYPYGGKQAPHQHINNKYNNQQFNRNIPKQTSARPFTPQNTIPTTGPKPSIPLTPDARYQRGQQAFQNRIIQDATNNPNQPYRQPDKPETRARARRTRRKGPQAGAFSRGAGRAVRLAGRAALPVTAGLMAYDGLMNAYGNDERDRRDRNIESANEARNRAGTARRNSDRERSFWDPESRTSIHGLLGPTEREMIYGKTRQDEEDEQIAMENIEAPEASTEPSQTTATQTPETTAPVEAEITPSIGRKEVKGATLTGDREIVSPMARENVSSKVNVGESGVRESGVGANKGRDWASIAQRVMPSVTNIATAAFAPKPKKTSKITANKIDERNPAFAAGRNRNAAGFRANPTQGAYAQFTTANNDLTAAEAQDRTQREQFNNQAETQADTFNIANEVRDNEATAQDQAARIKMITDAIQGPLDQMAMDKRGKEQMTATVALAASSIENEVERANFLNQVLALIEGGEEAEAAIEQARGN